MLYDLILSEKQDTIKAVLTSLTVLIMRRNECGPTTEPQGTPLTTFEPLEPLNLLVYI